MKIATDLAGFSLAEADILRKAMGKKVASIMKAQKQHFLQGAKKRGISSAKANEHLRTDQALRRIRVQQIPQRRLRLPRLPDGLSQGPPSRPLHGRPAHLGSGAGSDRPGRQVHQRMPGHGHQGPAPGHQRQRPPFHGRGAARSGSGWRRSRTSARGRSSRSWRTENAGAGSRAPSTSSAGTDPRIVNKKVLESLIKAGAFDSLGWRRSQCFHLIDALIDYGHDLQKMKVTPQSLLFGGSPRAARDPGRRSGR